MQRNNFIRTLLCALALSCAVPTIFAATIPVPDDATRAAWRSSLTNETKRDYVAAIAALQPLPRDYSVSLRLGWLHYLNTNHTAAVEHYRAAITVAPKSLEARLGIILPLLAQAHYAEAEAVAREILREHKNNFLAQLRLGVALRQQAKLSAAESVLTIALKHYPGNVLLLNELGFVKVAQNQFAAARYYFTEVTTLDPDNDGAYAQLANPKLFADLAETTGPKSPGYVRLPGFWLGKTAARMDVTTYAGALEYHGSALKDHALLAGVSAALGAGVAHQFEGGFDYIDITRLDGTHLHQYDATLAYANFAVPNMKFRFGGHYILGQDVATDTGWVLFGGADYFAAGRWNVGVDAAFSHYGNFTPLLEVVQVTPRLGVNLLNGADWTLRTDTKGYWIQLGEEVGLNQRVFFSAEERLSFFWKRWTLAGFGWLGRQAFAVRNDGGTLFNLAEEHTGGYGAEIKCATSARTSVAFRFSREEFREFGAVNSSASHSFIGFVGLAF